MRYTDPDGKITWDENGQGGTVTDKDTLSQITKEYNDANGTYLDYHDVAKVNGIENPNKIKPGQKIDFSMFSQPAQSSNLSTSNNSISSSVSNNQPNKSEMIGDILSYAYMWLNIASTICIMTGNVTIAGGLDAVATGCDLAATGIYLAGGCNDKASLSMTSAMLDFIPGPYKFNKGANRYISGTGKFVSNSLGLQAAIFPKAMGIGLNFLKY